MMKGAHSIEAKKEPGVNMKCLCHCETPHCGVEAIRSLRLLRRPFGPPRKDGINKNEQGRGLVVRHSLLEDVGGRR